MSARFSPRAATAARVIVLWLASLAPLAAEARAEPVSAQRLGVTVETVTVAMAAERTLWATFGLVVATVETPSGAEVAPGFEVGDQIIAVEGAPPGDAAAFAARLAALDVGATLRVTVWRSDAPLIVSATIVEAPAVDPPAVSAPPPSMAACADAMDEAALRARLGERSAQLSARIGAIDYDAVVESAWRAAGYDAEFERIVDQAIEELRSETNFFERMLDANVPSRAEETALRATQAVFGGPRYEALTETLSAALGRAVETRIGNALLRDGGTERSEGVALACANAYLPWEGENAFRVALLADAATRAHLLSRFQARDLSLATVLRIVRPLIQSTIAITLRRVIRTSMRRVIRRLTSRMIARISVIAGAILVLDDLINGGDVILEDIRETMLDEELRAQIIGNLATELQQASAAQIAAQGNDLTHDVVSRWVALENDYQVVRRLADEDAEFAAFLSALPPHNVELFSAMVAALQDEAALDALRSGALARVIERGATLAEIAALREGATTVRELANLR